MRTTLFICILFFASTFTSAAQRYKYLYYLNKDLVSVKKEDALFIGKGFYENKLLELHCFEKTGNSVFMQAHFTDSTLRYLHGNFKSFHPSGISEQNGYYVNGSQHGIWSMWDSTGKITDSIIYNMGAITKLIQYTYYSDGKIKTYSITDSADRQQTFLVYNNAGNIITRDSVNNEIFTTTDVPAAYAGGDRAFDQFLKKNLNMQVAFAYNPPSGAYTAVVNFIIDRDGSMSDITSETNHGFGMEEEVIRVLKKAKKWIPAMEAGNVVQEFRRLPITFFIYNAANGKKVFQEDLLNLPKDSNKVYLSAQHKPSFPGGIKAFNDYISQNLNQYTAQNRGAPAGHYTVTISFIVEKDGTISGLTQESVNGYGMEDEAKRVIRLSPLWFPALQNGYKVRYRMRHKVTFVVNKVPSPTHNVN